MKAFALTNAGIEQIAASELKELASASDIRCSSVITFDVKDFRDFCTLAYRSQSISRLCFLVCEFDAAESIAAAAKSLKQNMKAFKLSEIATRSALGNRAVSEHAQNRRGGFDINDWINESDSFVVECDRYGEHEFNSLDFATEANKIISEISGNKNISFKSPLLRFFCYINGSKGYFGVDVAGFDLGKREYRIFGHASDLKATAAYALVRLSGFSLGKRLLDPFCRSGAIAMEAALFASRFPVNYYRKDSFSFLKLKPFSKIDFGKLFASADKKIRKERQPIFNFSPSITHIVSSEKNAKIAGVNKLISFSRVDTEWLELKFSEEKVDFIVSFPPLLSKGADASKIKKVYSEFFYQANLILSKEGKIVLAARDSEMLEDAAKNRSFHLSSKLGFSMGAEKMLALVFGRG